LQKGVKFGYKEEKENAYAEIAFLGKILLRGFIK
jgi:hypothetical protein